MISSSNSRLYSYQERRNLAVIVSLKKINEQLIPAILAGAEKHLATRTEAVKWRADHFSLKENINTIRVVEALCDSHFRKQRSLGPSKEEIAEKINLLNDGKKPIILVGLMFTRKNISPLRRGGGDESLTDLGDLVSLVHLNSFASLINNFYLWGVKFMILSEGRRYAKAFDYDPKIAFGYQNNLKKLIRRLDLKHLSIYDYVDFLEEKSTPQELKIRQNAYNQVLKTYNQLILPILDPQHIDRSIKKAIMLDPRKDPTNPDNNFIPVWRSIINSLRYPELEKYAEDSNIEYDHLYFDMIKNLFIPRKNSKEEKLRLQIINKSWKAAIEHNSQELGDSKAKVDVAKLIGDNGFRTTINPKPGKYLGIYTIRETISRVQPWHGTGYLETDHSGRLVATVLSKLELESMSAIPVYVDKDNDQTFCYATQRAAEILAKSKEIVFNMSSRL